MILNNKKINKYYIFKKDAGVSNEAMFTSLPRPNVSLLN